MIWKVPSFVRGLSTKILPRGSERQSNTAYAINNLSSMNTRPHWRDVVLIGRRPEKFQNPTAGDKRKAARAIARPSLFLQACIILRP